MSVASDALFMLFTIAVWIALILLIIIILYYAKRWDITRILIGKKVDVASEIQNVYYHVNMYKRKVEHAKQILTLAYMARQNLGSNANDLDLPSSYRQGIVISQPNNIYTLLEKVFSEIMEAEDALFLNIRKANDNLRDYNLYIQSPVLPEIIARQRRLTSIDFEVNRLVEIEDDLNQGLSAITLLEADIKSLLRNHREHLPENAARSEDGADNTLDINGTSGDNQLDFPSLRDGRPR